MLSFASPEYLYLLLLLLLGIAFWIWTFIRSRASERRYAEVKLLGRLKPEASGKRRIWRGALLLLAIGALIVSLSRPRVPKQADVSDSEKGFELVVCLDISNSMLAQDIAPSRLDFSKRVTSRLFSKLGGNRVGLVVFAGSAFAHIPITTDLSTATDFISGVDPSLISKQGTAITQAMEVASRSFSANKKIGKAILLITDGEDHMSADSAALDPVRYAEILKKEGVKTFVLGVGAKDGATIPMPDGTLMMDEEGNAVITSFDEEMCRKIAVAGDGSFFSGGSAAAIERAIFTQLEGLNKVDIMSAPGAGYREIFGYFIAFALVLLLIEIFVFERKSRLLARFKLFDR